ncbi:MAG TPA: PLDc N-terminal domain-containing protein [Thermoanaerobaculia bacterium]|nr:PLDc N-terminal domain-containing protein [Thermoanaerobaculia bacterium]
MVRESVSRRSGIFVLLLVLSLVAWPLVATPEVPVPPPADTTTVAPPADDPADVPPLDDTTTASTTTYYEEDSPMGDEEGALVCAGCAAVGVALPLVILGISIAIAIWIHRDATARNIPNAVLWALLGFLFNLVGLVIYLIARKNMAPPQAPPGSAPPSYGG